MVDEAAVRQCRTYGQALRSDTGMWIEASLARYVESNPAIDRGKTWRIRRFAAGWALGMWRLCIEDDEANRTVVNLVRKEYTIGRAEENAVRLTERNVSRRHATLRRTGDKWLLEDLESDTGSYVNERRVEEPTTIDHRDKIRIGDYDITLLDSEKEAEEAAVDKQNETVPASVESDRSGDRHDRLVVIEGPNPGTQYPLLDKKLLIGRGEECDLTLPDTSVSRVHASLMRDEHGRFHISDQKSSNGVRVNGMEITKIPLYAGDVIELGDVHLQFVPKGSRFDESALRPATAARSVPTKGQSGGKLWVGLGLLGVVGGVVWFGSQTRVEPPQALQPAVTTTVEDSLLTQAASLLDANDTDGALTLLKSVPVGSPQRTSARFQSLAASWANHQFRKVETATTPAEQRVLLMQIVGFEDVGETHLNSARDQLRALATANADAGTQTGAATAVDPNTLPAAPTVAPVVAAKPSPVPVRPATRPPVPAAPPKPAPTPHSGTASTAPSPTPSAPPPVQNPTPPPPQPVAPQTTSVPTPAPAPTPPAPKPAPPPAPTAAQPPAPAAPPPVQAPPVNSPPVLNWPGAAP